MSVADAEAELKRALDAMLQAACPLVTDQAQWSADTIAAFQDSVCRAQMLLDVAVSQAAVNANARNAINRLPAELLCMIFKFYFADTHDSYDALLPLMQVCRHWHRIATCHAALWTKISISFALHGNAGRALSRLSASLARAKNAPVDLNISVSRRRTLAKDCIPDLDGSEEPLQAHMSHIRSLRIDSITKTPFHGLWRVAFTMPAPKLRSLMLTLTRDSLTDFPQNMFSGCAPLLEEINLVEINLPAWDWPPLRSLKRFTFRTRESVNLGKFVRFLHGCPALAFFSLSCSELKYAEPVPALDAPPAPTEVHVTVTQFHLDTPDQILRMLWATLPAHLSLTIKKATLMLSWLNRFIINPRTLSFCVEGVSMHSRITTTISATDAVGHMRTLYAAGIVPLDNLTPYFASISQLTLSEVQWPGFMALPSIPNLQLFRIDLVDPISVMKQPNRYPGMGIFLLDIHPLQSYVWRFTQLRTLCLSYQPSYFASLQSPSTYIVSAHEVRLFLHWHLHSDLPLQLVLNNVELLEDMSEAMKTLSEMVESISVVPGDRLVPSVVDLDD